MFLPWFVWRGFLNLTLDRGCSKMPFRKADSLVSCGRMTDSCKKMRFQKYQDSCGRGLNVGLLFLQITKSPHTESSLGLFVIIVTVASVQFELLLTIQCIVSKSHFYINGSN